MTSGLDTAPGSVHQCGSCRDQPPHSARPRPPEHLCEV